MKNSISIQIPSDIKYYSIVQNALFELSKSFDKKDIEMIDFSLKELINNSIKHAYKNIEGIIDIDFHPFLHGISIDVTDRGIPMSHHLFDKIEHKGFQKIHKLMDKFTYKNLGTKGKKFTILKYSSSSIEDIPKKSDNYKKEIVSIDQLVIREFKAGDEDDISRLIYENYGLSYVKDMFYYPSKILEFHGKKFYSIVVDNGYEIVGHFAFVFAENSNIAEIGIAVVSPAYQGKGLMNKMFDKLLAKAQEITLDALYGEAIMFHIYSQKSNIKHHFYETALEIGKLVNTVKLKGNVLADMEKRGSVLIAYKLLNFTKKNLFIPTIYKDKVVEIYENYADIEYQISHKDIEVAYSNVYYIFEAHHNIAIIVIDSYNKDDFYYIFHSQLDKLRAKHCDMIYADINMEKISQIDEVVDILNHALFFFSGVMLLKYKEQDYLQLQYKHSEDIGKKNLVCYSDFCKSLLKYILDDEKRVRELKGVANSVCNIKT
jgi:anti-sigma regulatory factor (Ser/Thr protein kinase)/N-acetylglutamate synthase-like GNAT family acetyltransferase